MTDLPPELVEALRAYGVALVEYYSLKRFGDYTGTGNGAWADAEDFRSLVEQAAERAAREGGK